MSVHLDKTPALDRWTDFSQQYRALHALHADA